MSFPSATTRTLLRIGLWTACIIPTLIFLWTALAPVGVPAILRIAAVGMLAFTLVRPRDALLLLAAAVPVMSICSGALGAPFGGQWSEVFVLAWLGGYMVNGARRVSDGGAVGDIATPAVLFAAVALTSGITVVGGQGLHFADFPASLRAFLLRDYFMDRGQFRPLADGVFVVESVALLLLVARLCTAQTLYRHQLARMMVVGTAAAAGLNIVRLLSAALRTGSFVNALALYFPSVRINVHYADINAAGSQFAMLLPLAFGVAAVERRGRAAWGFAAGAIAIALWMTHSRTAILAVLAVVAGLWLWSEWRRRDAARRRRLAWLSASLVAAVAIIGAAVLGLNAPGRPASEGLAVRLVFAQAAIRMSAEHPLFGVGISQFYEQSADYFPAAFRTVYYPRENAHNNFLQILAELGVAGFGCFAWILVAVGARARRTPEGRPIARAAAAGATVFLLTALGGHPLLTPQVAYTFWMVLGLAASAAPPVPAARPPRWIVATLLLLLVAVLPLRIRDHQRNANMEHVAFGVSAWSPGDLEWRTRTVGRHAIIYVPATAQGIEMPMRGSAENAGGATIEIWFNGQMADRIYLMGTEWQPVRIPLPHAHGRRYHRMELFVKGTTPPADGDASVDAGVEMRWMRLLGETGGSR